MVTKYKKLRNLCTSLIQKESVDYNNNRVEKANDDNEIWKIVKEVSNGNKSTYMAKKAIKHFFKTLPF